MTEKMIERKQPKYDLTQLIAAKNQVRQTVKQEQQIGPEAIRLAMAGFMNDTPGLDRTLKGAKSELYRALV